MKISSAGLSIIKEFEGFRANAYRDPVGYTKRPLASLVASTRF